MSLEIERKFLVLNDDWRASAREAIQIVQGYAPAGPGVLRVRIAAGRGFLTLKRVFSARSRIEFEREISVKDAHDLLDGFCGPERIEKTRYIVPCMEAFWEVDVFEGLNKGLVLAEIELETEEQAFGRPPWLGREVTSEPAYMNSNLACRPFSEWRNIAN